MSFGEFEDRNPERKQKFKKERLIGTVRAKDYKIAMWRGLDGRIFFDRLSLDGIERRFSQFDLSMKEANDLVVILDNFLRTQVWETS